MKLLTTNFLTCAVKACRGTAEAYPLHFSECELESTDIEYNPAFILNIMPRIEWDALVKVCQQLGNHSLPIEKPEDFGPDGARSEVQEEVLRSLHNVLLQTSITNGKMVCGRCGHIYLIKQGIANMLLAEHEVV